MYPELTQFQNWLTCQYPHSSVRKHYMSDLALFFSYAEKPPSAITFRDVDEYIQPLPLEGTLSAHGQPQVVVASHVLLFSLHRQRCFHAMPGDPETALSSQAAAAPAHASEERIQILFSHIHSPRDKAMFTLMLECGLRVGEVHNLSLEDVLSETPPQIIIHGKGDRHRIAYLRLRRGKRSSLAHQPPGPKGSGGFHFRARQTLIGLWHPIHPERILP